MFGEKLPNVYFSMSQTCIPTFRVDSNLLYETLWGRKVILIIISFMNNIDLHF